MQLLIKNLSAKVEDKNILNNFNLQINDGEIHAIMGPNGTGKSTLSKIIMGYPDYDVSGDILVNNNSIINLEINERSKLGIFLVYQNPISIDGITNLELIKSSLDSRNESNGLYQLVKELGSLSNSLEMPKEMLNRSLNVGFSGGERKKNEILQLLDLKPKLVILDELDSGLDVDSLKIVCDSLNNYINENKDVSILMITHYTRILEYIKPTHVHMMKDGKIVKSGDYELAKLIEKNGYNQSFIIDKDKDNE